MALFRQELLDSGISGKQVQSLNFEEAKNIDLNDWKKLHDEIEKKLVKDKMNYIFLDEIQNVVGFEKMIDSLFVKENVDLYITGSNAYFLSGEFATLLSGRQMEISVLPFSFKEYLAILEENNEVNYQNLFINFLRDGGFPQSVGMFQKNYDLGKDYLSGLYNTVVLKDIVTRKGVNDSSALENVMKFVFDNVGNLMSPKRIADYMGNNYRKISSRTVEKFLLAARDSFIIYAVNRLI